MCIYIHMWETVMQTSAKKSSLFKSSKQTTRNPIKTDKRNNVYINLNIYIYRERDREMVHGFTFNTCLTRLFAREREGVQFNRPLSCAGSASGLTE